MDKRPFLLVANGTLGQRTVEKLNGISFEKTIAADGGATRAVDMGLIPDVVVGDMDSCPVDFFAAHPHTERIVRRSQEINDLEKALICCLERRADAIVAVGITGGQLDHQLNNFSVLAKYCNQIQITVLNEEATIYIVKNGKKIKTEPGQIISLIPWGRASGITTRGLRYPLKNESLGLGEREGARNEALDFEVEVKCIDGTILVIVADR